MYPALTDVVDMIHTGASARAIICKYHISARKLERALNSVRLTKILDLERRVQTAYLRFLVTRFLPKAVEGLADLAEYSRPETKRKACMTLIAAATGINFAVPGASVYPEDLVEGWQKLDGPDDGSDETAICDQNWQKAAESGAPLDTPTAQDMDSAEVTESVPAAAPAKRGVVPRAHAGVPPAAKRGRSRAGAGAPPAGKRVAGGARGRYRGRGV